MPTPTARAALLKATTSDPFVTQDLADNWQRVDDFVVGRVCTISSRPTTWGAAHAGMLIVESDTGLAWRWTGTAFVRQHGVGVLRTSGGGLAVATRTTDFSTSSISSFVVVLAVTSVVVPDGNRPLLILIQGAKGENTNGAIVTQIARSNVGNQGPFLAQSGLVGDASSPSAGAQGAGFVLFGWELSGLAAGTYNWSFQIRSSATYGGTSYIRADANAICRIAVVEM